MDNTFLILDGQRKALLQQERNFLCNKIVKFHNSSLKIDNYIFNPPQALMTCPVI